MKNEKVAKLRVVIQNIPTTISSRYFFFLLLLALAVFVFIDCASTAQQAELRSNYRSKNGSESEEISRNAVATIQISADAEQVNSFTDSYNNAKAKKVYAFAAVRKVDLALYYAQKIESALGEAQRFLELAEQMAKAM